MNILYKSKTLMHFSKEEIIYPPQELDPIFISQEQSDTSLEHLAITYACIPLEYRCNLQLFEVPPIADDCGMYCARAYSSYQHAVNIWQPDATWIEIADKINLVCRKGFEMVLYYDKWHFARSWGDGTFLHKCGGTKDGATMVLRVSDPRHPYIVSGYGDVKRVWIRPASNIPVPFFRSQSSYLYGPCAGSIRSFPRKEVIETLNQDDWKIHYQQAKKSLSKQISESLQVSTDPLRSAL